MIRLIPIFALLAVAVSQTNATPLSSLSGTYSVVSAQLVPEAVASIRLSLDDNALLTADSLLGGGAGVSFTLDNSILSLLTNGQGNVFSLEMNLGRQFDAMTAGGGIGFFDSALEANYHGDPVSAIVFEVDQLLFESVATPLGLGTQVTLNYTIAIQGATVDPLHGLVPNLGSGLASNSSSGFTSSAFLLAPPPPAEAAPEPGTWATLGLGITLVLVARARYPAEK